MRTKVFTFSSVKIFKLSENFGIYNIMVRIGVNVYQVKVIMTK